MSPRLCATLGVLLATVACQQPSPPPPPPATPTAPAATVEPSRYFGEPPDGKLHVYFFDVGAGDSALIVSPEGHTVLVDAGPASATTHLMNRLPELLRRELDLVVLTHPHPDHFGALDPLLRRVGARQLMEPQLPGAPEDYDALLTAVGSRKVQIISPAPSPSAPNAPLKLPVGTGVELTVLWPRAPTEPLLPADGDAALEDNSIVLRLTYGDTSVLFAGDAHARTEAHLVARGAPLRATLLKVGAHGADSATTAAFLGVVRPQAAIVSASPRTGRDTATSAAEQRLEAVGARVFRTEQDGEVQAVSDGKEFVLTTQRVPAGSPLGTRFTFSGVDLLPPAEVAAVPPTTTSAPTPAPKAVPARATAESGTRATMPPSVSDVVELDDLPSARKPSDSEPDEATPRTRAERPPRTGKGATPVSLPREGFVASRNSEVFHVPGCRAVKRMRPENIVRFATRTEAARNLRPAKDCNP